MASPKFDKKELEFVYDAMKYTPCLDLKIKKSVERKLQRALTPIKISSRKGKGRNLQQWVCKQISEITGILYTKDDNSLIQSRPMSQSGVDIILHGKASELFPFSIECKNTENISLYSVIEQAKNNSIGNKSWMVIHKRKGFEPIVIMDWETFRKIYTEKGYLL